MRRCLKSKLAGLKLLRVTPGMALLVAWALLTQMTGIAHAQSVTLAWDANSESNLAGYRIYRSEQSGSFTSVPLNGQTLYTNTTFTDSTVQYGRTYYYAVTAVSSTGEESAKSAAVQAVIGESAIAAPTSPGTLVGHWKLDEGFGSTVFDSSSSGLSGSLKNGPSWAAGRIERALQFDGLDDYVDLANPSILNFGTGSFSYSLWVHVSQSAGDHDMPWWKGGSSAVFPGYDMELGQGDWSAYASDGAVLIGATFGAETLNQWVLLTAVIDRSANEFRTYRNGGLVATRSLQGLGSVSSSQPARIGGSVNGYPFRGLIDDVRVYSRALSSAEVMDLYNVPLPVTGNKAPSVDAGPDQSVTLPQSVTVTANATDDNLPNGTLTYQWNVLSGLGATIGNPASNSTPVSFSEAGTYVLGVTVSDGLLSASDTVTITVNSEGNQPPAISAIPDQTVILPATATLTAVAKDDGLPNNTMTYQWNVLSGLGATIGNPASNSTPVSFSEAGTYVLGITVSDGLLSASDTVTITVNSEGNQPPAISAIPDQTVILPATATLTAVAKDDGLPNNTMTYQWSVVSGSGVTFSSPSAASTTAAFSSPGVYTMKVTVSDGLLDSSVETTVTAMAASFTVSAGPDITLTESFQTTLRATVAYEGQAESAITYEWTIVSGTGAVISSPGAATTTVTFSAAGAYTFRVTARKDGVYASDDVAVFVGAGSITLVVSRHGAVVQEPNTLVRAWSDDASVHQMSIIIDGNVRTTVSGSSVSYRWDTRRIPGNHEIEAVAYRNGTIVASKKITVYVH